MVGVMTEPVRCGAPTPNGPCTRKVIPGEYPEGTERK